MHRSIVVAVVVGLVLAGRGVAASARTTACPGVAHVRGQALPAITVLDVRGMSCAAGVRVMRTVAPALGEHYYERLGTTRNRLIRGYRCSGRLIGDAAWLITCRRGARRAIGLAAE